MRNHIEARMRFDVALFRWINGFAGHHPVIDKLMTGVANYAPLVVVVVLLACWGRWTRAWQRAAALATIAALLALGVGQLLNTALPRPRPFLVMDATVLVPHAPDPSFPSDHAILMFAVTVVLASVSRRLAGWLAVFSILVLIARVYVGVHYPADVLGGAVLGAAAGQVTLRVARTPAVERWIAALFDRLARLHVAAWTTSARATSASSAGRL